MTATWNHSARPCPVSPCQVDRLFHGKDLRHRSRMARRAVEEGNFSLSLVGSSREPTPPLQGELPPPLQGALFPVQGEHGHAQRHSRDALGDPTVVWPSDAALWHLLDTAKTNYFAPPGVAEAIEAKLCLTPVMDEVVATIQPTARWMEELGGKMWDLGLNNTTAVLVGAQQQLYTFDGSPRARLGETTVDPCPGEFPLRLHRATCTTPRTRPLQKGPTSTARPQTPTPGMRSPCPGRTASEGPY